jgi:hypothetical protein
VTDPPPAEPWRDAWRRALAPLLTTPGLRALRRALAGDDPALLQGAVTSPPPTAQFDDEPADAACALAYCGWQGDGLASVREVDLYFAGLCHEADRALGAPGACLAFVAWYDAAPRAEMRRLLLEEVDRALAALGRPPGAAPG